MLPPSPTRPYSQPPILNPVLKKTLIIVAVLLGLAAIVGGVGAWIAFAPNTPSYEGERSVKIPRGAGFAQAVDSLQASGLLRSRRTFTWVARLTGWGSQIKAGHYAIADGASNVDLLQTLRRGLQAPIRLTIPPGSRPEVIAAVVGRDMGDFDKEDFRAVLRDPVFAASLDTDTTHLFAYLLPETYHFYWLTDAETVVRRIKEHFDAFYTPAMQAKADSLGLTTGEVLNLAAIVEWETSHVPEKARIAGVYLNRLQRPGWRLQADPTVQYAVLEREGQKRRLFNVDYDIVHPYNTYLIDGLPPGPVTNPSKS
ncbi:MAG: endolytic transglycosylase MltG, partial [Bacteroidetes bacterium]|nr:endolytic transglycosylase MltG [Bacteroidota bacterium]